MFSIFDIPTFFVRADFCFGDGGGLKMARFDFFEKSGKKKCTFSLFGKKVRVIQEKVSFGPTIKDFPLIFVANERSTI